MIENFWIILSMMMVIGALFAIWSAASNRAGEEGPLNIFGIQIGAALLAGRVRKKGIMLTTTMLASIIMIVVVALIIFLIFGTIQAEAGRTGSGFFFGAFDAIIRLLPWVK